VKRHASSVKVRTVKSIGLVGLGLLGTALAERLLARGWSVTGFDIDSARREALIRSGGTAIDVLSEIAAFDWILLSLPTSQIVLEVVSTLDPHLHAGQTIVDTTTGNPSDAESVAAKLAQRNVEYLDATIGGSSQQARDGEAIIMCGGNHEAFARCHDLFEDMARRRFHLGAAGSGSRMKLAVNLVLGLNRAVLAEGLAFAGKMGLNPDEALDVLKAGPARSHVMDTKGEKMLRADFEPQARLAQHLKDVQLILQTGLAADAHLPLSQLHQTLLDELIAAGKGELDNSVIIEAFRHRH
jgi:3-hydroxyisobutyrate dehydrogenase-like beta-hydroxyacid dehydrogenase